MFPPTNHNSLICFFPIPFSNQPNGPRPQSVASIHSSIPNTPSYDDLNVKLDTSGRNMLHIREQQQQLMRLQQVAKSQLQEMEQIRNQYSQMSFAGQPNGQPDYDNVEDVANDVSALMARMKSLTDFIHNQNDMATMLGGPGGALADDGAGGGSEMLDEQMQLQRKLSELKMKKQQMANLVSELQGMNDDAKQKYQEHVAPPTLMRNVPIEYERIVPIDLIPSVRSVPQQQQRYVAAAAATPPQQQQPARKQTAATAAEHDDHVVDLDEEGASGVSDDVIGEKICEINAMKNQLNRLKEMMNTVKMIEMKNGDCVEDDDGEEAIIDVALEHGKTSTMTPPLFENVVPIQLTHQPFNATNKNGMEAMTSTSQVPLVQVVEQPQRDREEVEMEERVRALHSMTADLRQQAVTLAAERDRLKDIKNEMRRNEELTVKQNVPPQQVVAVAHATMEPHHLQPQQIEQQRMKSEYEAKKKEFDKLVEKLDAAANVGGSGLVAPPVMDVNMHQQSLPQRKKDEHNIVDVDYYPENWNRREMSANADVSSSSSVHSGGGDGGRLRQMSEHRGNSNKHGGSHHHHHHHQQHHHQPGKHSADSGAADVMGGISVDAGSMQSGSSRGFSVPPPMRNLGPRDSCKYFNIYYYY